MRIERSRSEAQIKIRLSCAAIVEVHYFDLLMGASGIPLPLPLRLRERKRSGTIRGSRTASTGSMGDQSISEGVHLYRFKLCSSCELYLAWNESALFH